MKRYLFSFTLLLFLPIFNRAALNIDSLETCLKKAVVDTEKISLLCKISLEHINAGAVELARIKSAAARALAEKNGNTLYLIKAYNNTGLVEYSVDNNKEALFYFSKALDLAENNDLRLPSAETELNIGNTYYWMGDYANAIKRYKNSFAHFEKENIPVKCIEVLDMMATTFYMQNDFEEALNTHLKSLKLKEQLKDGEQFTFSYLGIGNIYYQKKEFENALKYWTMSKENAKKYNQLYDLGRAYNNIGRVYIDMGKPDLANEYNLMGLEAKEKNDPNDPDIINSLENIGSYYLHKNNFDSAYYFTYRALTLSRKLQSESSIAESLTNVAIILSKKNRTKEAIDTLNLALALAEKNLLLTVKRSVYEELALCYAKTGDFKNAFENQQKFSQISDSIINEANTRSMNEIMVKFDTEKKEQEIADLNKAKRLQNIITISIGSGLFIVLLLSFFLFKSFKEQKRAKLLVEEQKQIVEHKNEEITSSIVYAQRIQRAILPDEAVLNNHLPEHFIIYKPKDIVSGDFYWMADFDDYSFFAVADCTGHGVPGSLMSMMGVNLLNQISSHHHAYRPNEVLTELDYQLKKALHLAEQGTDKPADGMDIALIKIEKKTKRVHYAGANRPLLMIAEGELKEVKATKKAIGGDNNMELFQYTNHTFELHPGTLIYLSSDGYADQFGGPTGKKKMTTARMKEKLKECAPLEIKKQQEILDAFFEEWKGSTEQIDDILLAGIRV